MIRRFAGMVGRLGIANSASRIFAFQVLALVFALASSVLVARALGPEQKGLFDLYSLLLSMTVELGLLGLPAGLLYCAMTGREEIGRVHGTGIGVLLAACVFVAALYLVFSPALASLFPNLPGWVFVVVVGVLPASFYLVIWHNLMMSQDKAIRLQQIYALFGLFNFAAVLVLFATGNLNFAVFLAVSAALTIITAGFAFAYLGRAARRLTFDRGTAQRSIRFGLPIFLGSLANFLHFKVDQLMINAWVGLEGLGWYALSVRWAEMLFLLDSAILMSALYRIGSSPPRESRKFAARVTLTQLVVNILGGAGLSLFVLLTFEYIYGAEYAPSVVPILFLLPGILIWSALKPISNYLSYACGKGPLLGWFSAIGLLANIVLNYLLIRHAGLGIVGAAIASSLSYALVGMLVAVAAWLQKDESAEDRDVDEPDMRGCDV